MIKALLQTYADRLLFKEGYSMHRRMGLPLPEGYTADNVVEAPRAKTGS
jgi:hypothetical protein